jgi:hypothetical protein
MATIMSTPADNPQGDSEIEVCVPVENITEDGVPPQEGDDVELSVKGTVSKVEGDLAWITPSEVNGQPVEAGEGSPKEEANEGNEPDEQGLESAMQARDKEMGY